MDKDILLVTREMRSSK